VSLLALVVAEGGGDERARTVSLAIASFASILLEMTILACTRI